MFDEGCEVPIAESNAHRFSEPIGAYIAFGDLDCCQWLEVIGQHTLRHVCQIEEVKADPAFPDQDCPAA